MAILIDFPRINGKRLPSLHDKPYLAPLIKEGMEILDAGCGDGRYVFTFSRAGATAFGVDTDPALSHSVRNNAKRLKLENAFGLTGELVNLPFQSELFDLYTSFGVYEKAGWRRQRRMLSEAYRVLKPGGFIYLEVPQFWSAWTFRRTFRYWFRRIVPPGLNWQRNVSRLFLIREAERLQFRTIETHVFDAWTGFERGFSLDCPQLQGRPELFSCVRKTFRRLANYCDRREWVGNTLVYIGTKPSNAVKSQK